MLSSFNVLWAETPNTKGVKCGSNFAIEYYLKRINGSSVRTAKQARETDERNRREKQARETVFTMHTMLCFFRSGDLFQG